MIVAAFLHSRHAQQHDIPDKILFFTEHPEDRLVGTSKPPAGSAQHDARPHRVVMMGFGEQLAASCLSRQWTVPHDRGRLWGSHTWLSGATGARRDHYNGAQA